MTSSSVQAGESSAMQIHFELYYNNRIHFLLISIGYQHNQTSSILNVTISDSSMLV